MTAGSQTYSHLFELYLIMKGLFLVEYQKALSNICYKAFSWTGNGFAKSKFKFLFDCQPILIQTELKEH